MSWVVKGNLFAAAVNATVVVLVCAFGTPDTLTAVNAGCVFLNLLMAIVLWERR